jgi:hypothetical protein
MRLDVRYPIGGMFTILGSLLVLYGLLSDRAIYGRSLGINVNLWWGVVLLLFGLGMLWLAYRAERASRVARRAPDIPSSGT